MLTARECMDLLLIGHCWLNDAAGKVQPRRATMVFHALRELDLMTEAERKRLGKNTQLIGIALKEAHSLRVERRPPRRELERLRGTSDMHVILLVSKPPSPLKYARIFGNNGYYLLLTEKGEEYARNHMKRYARRVTRTSFLQAWGRARLNLGRQMGAIRKRERQQASGDSQQPETPIPRITPALYREEDWEW